MSLKLYTDKSEVFECNVSLQGASIKESKLRAILKFDDKNLMVEGKINSNGKGEILFPKLKNISEDGDVGTMELEVIAEDAYFQPYEETFSVAYELSQVGGTYSKRDLIYADLFRQRPDKKKKVIELIMKVKSNKYKEKVEIPMNAKVALSDIDLVIQEVLNKPMVNINVA